MDMDPFDYIIDRSLAIPQRLDYLEPRGIRQRSKHIYMHVCVYVYQSIRFCQVHCSVESAPELMSARNLRGRSLSAGTRRMETSMQQRWGSYSSVVLLRRSDAQ